MRAVGVAAVAFFLAGCGSGGTDSTAEQPGAVVASSAPSPSSVPVTSGRILFVSGPAQGALDVYAMDANGKGRARLTKAPGNDYDPSWSADRTRVVYAHQDPRAATSSVWTMNADGTGRKQISDGAYFVTEPKFSPDGTSIVFARKDADAADASNQLVTIGADGSKPRQITSGEARFSDPVFTPDGTRIVATRATGEVFDSQSRLWSMAPDGTDQRQITPDDPEFASDGEASISPDGRTIAFTRYPAGFAGSSSVWTIGVDGSSPVLVETDAMDPAYSPDGGRLVFTTGRHQDPAKKFTIDVAIAALEIYVGNVVDGSQRRLTRNAVSDQNPNW